MLRWAPDMDNVSRLRPACDSLAARICFIRPSRVEGSIAAQSITISNTIFNCLNSVFSEAVTGVLSDAVVHGHGS
jgi:hypothetical protein